MRSVCDVRGAGCGVRVRRFNMQDDRRLLLSVLSVAWKRVP